MEMDTEYLNLVNNYLDSIISIYNEIPQKCIVADDKKMKIVNYSREGERTISAQIFLLHNKEEVYGSVESVLEHLPPHSMLDIVCTDRIKQEIERLAPKWYEKDRQSLFTTDNKSSVMVYSIL